MNATPTLDALHRVALEAGVMPLDPPSVLADTICLSIRRLRSENASLGGALEKANHRLDILEGTVP